MSTKIYKQFLSKQLARSGNHGNDFILLHRFLHHCFGPTVRMIQDGKKSDSIRYAYFRGNRPLAVCKVI